MVILPLDEKYATFVPQLGSVLGVRSGKFYRKCMYTGSSFEVPELCVMILTLLKDDRPETDTKGATA
jgi:hypothetical protein